MKKVEEEKMDRDGRKIIKEQREKGVVVYRYSDFNEEIDADDMRDADLNWRLTIIIEKFKIFLSLIEDKDDSLSYGIVLGAVIKDAEREIEGISEFIEKSLGRIGIIYNEGVRFGDFSDRTVAGLIFHPSSEQSSR